MRTCKVNKCNHKYFAKGLCRCHYDLNRRRKQKIIKNMRDDMETINQSIIEEREWIKNNPPFKVDEGEIKPFKVY